MDARSRESFERNTIKVVSRIIIEAILEITVDSNAEISRFQLEQDLKIIKYLNCVESGMISISDQGKIIAPMFSLLCMNRIANIFPIDADLEVGADLLSTFETYESQGLLSLYIRLRYLNTLPHNDDFIDIETLCPWKGTPNPWKVLIKIPEKLEYFSINKKLDTMEEIRKGKKR